MINLGVIGYGYWGPNVVRNFSAQPDCRVVAICDKHPPALAQVASRHPSARVLSDTRELMTSRDIDAVAIVTPVSTHYELAKQALLHGKHVFVEKPFTATSAQAEELIELADRKNLQIMVDHTFLFTGAVRKIKELVDEGVLGPLYYYDSTRVNLGLFQHDVNVIWDLGPHDISIVDYLIGLEPEMVAATGGAHLNGLADMAYITLYFPNGIVAHINVNWLSPVKVRTTLIGGQRKMLVWNDLEPAEKIKVYDKGVDVGTERGPLPAPRELPQWRHVGAPDRGGRGPAARGALFSRLHRLGSATLQRRPSRSARRQDPGGGRRVAQAAERDRSSSLRTGYNADCSRADRRPRIGGLIVGSIGSNERRAPQRDG